MGAKFLNTFFVFLNLVLKQLLCGLYISDICIQEKTRTLGVQLLCKTKFWGTFSSKF